jgi:hypothetical protein
MKILAAAQHPGGINAIIPPLEILIQNDADVLMLTHDRVPKLDKNTLIPYSSTNGRLNSELNLENIDLIMVGPSIVDGTEPSIDKKVVRMAMEQGIPSLMVLDNWNNLDQKMDYANGAFGIMPTQVAVMDEHHQNALIDMDFPAEHITVTGGTQFDKLPDVLSAFTPEDYARIRDEIGIQQGALTFFYAGNAFQRNKDSHGYWDLDNIEILGDAVAKNPILEVITKLHPRMTPGSVKEITDYMADHGRGRMHFVTTGKPTDFVLSSDLTITPGSTIGLEAAYMNAPVISIQPDLKGEDELARLTQTKLIPYAFSTGEAKQLIGRVVDAEFRNGMRKKLTTFTTDGKATERVVELAYKTANVKI